MAVHKAYREIDIGKVQLGLLRRRFFRLFAIAGGLQRRVRCHERQQVADMDHAARVVERVVIDDEPRMRGAFEKLDQFTQ